MNSTELNDLIGRVRNLAGTIRDVRSRIESSNSTYVGNESRTRYGLIDPILEQLGWDVRDPIWFSQSILWTAGVERLRTDADW